MKLNQLIAFGILIYINTVFLLCTLKLNVLEKRNWILTLTFRFAVYTQTSRSLFISHHKGHNTWLFRCGHSEHQLVFFATDTHLVHLVLLQYIGTKPPNPVKDVLVRKLAHKAGALACSNRQVTQSFHNPHTLCKGNINRIKVWSPWNSLCLNWKQTEFYCWIYVGLLWFTVPITLRVVDVFLPLTLHVYTPASSILSFLISSSWVAPLRWRVYRPPCVIWFASFFQVTGALSLESKQLNRTDSPSIASWLSSSFSKNTEAAAVRGVRRSRISTTAQTYLEYFAN